MQGEDYCCKQSLTRLQHPSIQPFHPSIHPVPLFFKLKIFRFFPSVIWIDSSIWMQIFNFKFYNLNVTFSTFWNNQILVFIYKIDPQLKFNFNAIRKLNFKNWACFLAHLDYSFFHNNSLVIKIAIFIIFNFLQYLFIILEFIF